VRSSRRSRSAPRVAAGADLHAQTAEPATATTIEQALIEHACSTPPAVALDPATHDECLQARLTALRADFGHDLARLAAAERRAIDSSCAQIRGTQGRDGYLDCLSRQLAAIHNRRSPTRAAASAPASVVDPAAAAPVVASTASASDVATPSPRPWLLLDARAGAGRGRHRRRGDRRAACATRLPGLRDACGNHR